MSFGGQNTPISPFVFPVCAERFTQQLDRVEVRTSALFAIVVASTCWAEDHLNPLILLEPLVLFPVSVIHRVKANPLAGFSYARSADQLLVPSRRMRIGHHRDEYFGRCSIRHHVAPIRCLIGSFVALETVAASLERWQHFGSDSTHTRTLGSSFTRRPTC